MSNPTALTATNMDATIMEQVVATGNLAALTPEQRVNYYRSVCDSLGLNPLTQPFQYITLNGKLTLYARKDATDQLRSIKCISIDKPDIRFEDEWIIVTVVAQDAAGRRDADIGVVSRKDMRGDFGNALMKAVTKAKRRVTLSICGLGMLDETEIETIPAAQPVTVDAATGEIIAPHWIDDPDTRSRFWASAKSNSLDENDVHAILGVAHMHDYPYDKAQAHHTITEYLKAKRSVNG